MKRSIFDRLKNKLSLAFVAGTILFSGCTTLDNKVENSLPEKFNPREEYALLINGDEESTDNILTASNKLREIGYKPENIISLGGEFSPKSVYNRNFKSGRRESFDEAVDYLKKKVDNNDSLLVYTTGHGAICEGIGYLVLDDELVEVEKIIKHINKIPFHRLIYIGDQCYSGAVVDKLRKLDRNLVAVSCIDATQSIFPEKFIEGFWEAIGNLDYDLNNDGVVDVEESYKEGMKRLNEGFYLHLIDATFPGQYLVNWSCEEPLNIQFNND